MGAVQDFQALTHWCSQDLDRTKAVQRALKILRVPKGWQNATAHAKTAVAEDHNPRMFTSGGGLALVYRCRQGKVDLSTVLGSHDILCCTCTCTCTRTWLDFSSASCASILFQLTDCCPPPPPPPPPPPHACALNESIAQPALHTDFIMPKL